MTLSIIPEESYSCSNCGRGMGEFSAMCSLELYGDIMCGKCIFEILVEAGHPAEKLKKIPMLK